MYFLVSIFACLISSTVFSCTPPAESRLAIVTVLTTSTASSTITSRAYNSLDEDVFVHKNTHTLRTDSELSLQTIQQLLKDEHQSLAISYFDWPGAEQIAIALPRFATQENFESVYP